MQGVRSGIVVEEKGLFFDHRAIWQAARAHGSAGLLAHLERAALFHAIDAGRVGDARSRGFLRWNAGQKHKWGKKGKAGFHCPINCASNGYFVRFSQPVSVINT